MSNQANPAKAKAEAKSKPPVAAAFGVGDSVVYPGHGVGTVIRLDMQEVGGLELKLFVINFAQDRMTLSVPTHKVTSSGLRHVSTRRVMEEALAALKGPRVQSRAMWNRRAIEYAAKINSGDPLRIAEVVRDLHSAADEREPSHSQKLLFEQALGRLVQELAVVDDTHVEEAGTKLELLLNAA